MTVTPTATTHLPPHPTAPATTVPWTDLLAAATDDCLAALLKGADQDWSRPAHALDWTCRQTLDHLALGLMGYTGLLIARPDDRYITLFASLDPQAPIPACLDGLRIAASLLTSTVRDTTAEARAWHPWGHSDATGFAAMGITELAVHTYDITRALGLSWAPPAVAQCRWGIVSGARSSPGRAHSRTRSSRRPRCTATSAHRRGDGSVRGDGNVSGVVVNGADSQERQR